MTTLGLYIKVWIIRMVLCHNLIADNELVDKLAKKRARMPNGEGTHRNEVQTRGKMVKGTVLRDPISIDTV